MLIEIPARTGKAAFVEKGQAIKMVNTHGTQVIDVWAFRDEHASEFMSMPHTHSMLGSLGVKPGQAFFSNEREAMLTLLEDTSPGVHDTVMASCDRWRYEQLGCTEGHANCADNLVDALHEFDVKPPVIPAPWNVWMNVPFAADGSTSWQPPVSKPGDFVVLRAEMDAIVAMSACPQDMVPVNGADCVPKSVEFQVYWPKTT